jgi:transcriptional adapter 2-alpha
MQISLYSRLDERKRRKEFILERGLLNLKRQQALDRKRTKEERELYNRCRVFMRYHSMEEHEALLNGLIAERKLRQRIEELQVFFIVNTRFFGSEVN